MKDVTTITVDMTDEVIEIDRKDFEILSGSGEAPRPIEGGRSFLIAEILRVIARGLIDKDYDTLKEHLEWCTKEFEGLE